MFCDSREVSGDELRHGPNKEFRMCKPKNEPRVRYPNGEGYCMCKPVTRGLSHE